MIGGLWERKIFHSCTLPYVLNFEPIKIFEILKVTQKFKWTNNADYEHIYEQIQKAGKNIQEWKDMNYKWEASSELAV